MMKPNKTVMLTVRITEDERSKLEAVRKPGETQSECIRRLISDTWYEMMAAQDRESGYPSISDRVNCL